MKTDALTIQGRGTAGYSWFQSVRITAARLIPALLVVLIFAPGILRADIESEAAKELDKVHKADQEAKDNMPNEGVRRAENDLDQAAKKNDDVKDNPKSTQKQKDDAQDAEDAARAKADKAVEDNKDLQAPGKDVGKYRDALKKRRDARRELKKKLAELKRLLQKRKEHLDDTTYQELQRQIREIEELDKPFPSVYDNQTSQTTTRTETIFTQTQEGKISYTLTSTGETIGTVATVRIHNNTPQSVNVTIPSTVIQPQDGKSQHYAIPQDTTAKVPPSGDKVVPLDGVCTQPHRPPADNGSSQIALLDPTTPDFKRTYGPQLTCTQEVIRTAKELQKEGKFHTPFSSNPKKELQSVVQQTVWTANPTHDGPSITKEDLTHTVYKQVNVTTEEQKKQLQPGIDSIWSAVQLTGRTAKVIVDEGQTPVYEVSDQSSTPTSEAKDVSPTPTPTPSTTEKPKEAPKPAKPQDNPLNPEGVLGGNNGGLTIGDPETQANIEAAKKAKERINETQEKLKRAKDAFNDKKQAAINKDPQVQKSQEKVDHWTKTAKSYDKATKEDKELFERKIKEEQDRLNRAKGNAEKQWAGSDEGKQAGKDLGKAEKEADAAKQDAKQYGDLEEYHEDAPQQRIDEPGR